MTAIYYSWILLWLQNCLVWCFFDCKFILSDFIVTAKMFSLILLWLENCKNADQKETWIVHHQFADLGDFARICWLNPQMSAETSIHPTLLCLAWSAKDILTTFYLELLELKVKARHPLYVSKPIKAPYPSQYPCCWVSKSKLFIRRQWNHFF